MKHIIALIIFSLSFNVFAQHTITPPSEGKSVIYFVRTASPGILMNFKYFDKDKYLGKFNGINFFRYECEPGSHLFWVKSENFDFVEADLKEGGVYILEVKGRMGAASAASKFFLVDYEDTRQMKRINKVFAKAEGADVNKEDLEEKYEDIKERMMKTMRSIQRRRVQRPDKIKKITQEMAYTIQ